MAKLQMQSTVLSEMHTITIDLSILIYASTGLDGLQQPRSNPSIIAFLHYSEESHKKVLPQHFHQIVTGIYHI